MGNKKEKKKASDAGRRRGILREFSAGGIVYKKTPNLILWLISRSKPSADYPFDVWRFPKGWIDDAKGGMPGPIARGHIKASEEDLQSTALREVKEEAGVNAKIVKKLGSEMFVFNSKLRKGRVLKFVTFYLMEWLSDSPEGFGTETSEVVWLPYDEVRQKLTHSNEKKMLDKAKTLLDSGEQQSLV